MAVPTDDSSTPHPASGLGRRDAIGRSAETASFIVLIGAITLFASAVVTYAWSAVKLWDLVDLLIDNSDSSVGVVKLLEVIDLVLLGTVVLITAMGLIELFITPLRLPQWLIITDLGDLKAKLLDVILLVAAIKFLEKLVVESEPLDVLWYGLAVAVVIAVIIAAKWTAKN